jgi:hypothetical protein
MLQKITNIFVKLCRFTAVAVLVMIVNSAFATIPALGWNNTTVSDINNWGQISGTSTADSTTSAFLITQIPEPETYAMLMAGLGVIGFAASRRKSSGKSYDTLREVMLAHLSIEGP